MAQRSGDDCDRGYSEERSASKKRGNGRSKNLKKKKHRKRISDRRRARKRRRRLEALSAVRVFLFVIAIPAVIGLGAYENTYDQPDPYLEGKGTDEEPYLIGSVEDLKWLSGQVNAGTEFDDVYFRQVSDLDLSDYGNWVPIGAFGLGYYFRGVYDGQGHSIQNITIDGSKLPGDDESRANVGLFGVLAGTVCNLRIESGTITGHCIGSIASHGTDEAVIANCYNQAALSATGRCGGIADDFGKGKIIACANAGALTCTNEQWIGGISSYSAGIIYGCCSTGSPVPDQFKGELYRTGQVQDVYPGISDENLEQAQKIFVDDLEGVELIGLKAAT